MTGQLLKHADDNHVWCKHVHAVQPFVNHMHRLAMASVAMAPMKAACQTLCGHSVQCLGVTYCCRCDRAVIELCGHKT